MEREERGRDGWTVRERKDGWMDGERGGGEERDLIGYLRR